MSFLHFFPRLRARLAQTASLQAWQMVQSSSASALLSPDEFKEGATQAYLSVTFSLILEKKKYLGGGGVMKDTILESVSTPTCTPTFNLCQAIDNGARLLLSPFPLPFFVLVLVKLF